MRASGPASGEQRLDRPSSGFFFTERHQHREPDQVALRLGERDTPAKISKDVDRSLRGPLHVIQAESEWEDGAQLDEKAGDGIEQAPALGFGGEATSNVWQLPVSVQTGHVAGSARRLTFGTALERSAAVSADGHITFAGVTENVDVWRVPLDARTGDTHGTPERVTEDAAPDHALNVSADGRTLAFRSSRTGREEVWLKDLQTGTERQLTHSGASVARISPDGLKVAVERDAGEHQRVELHDLSGGQPSTLCDDCSSSGGGWSSDGSRLLIGRRRGATQALVMLDVSSRREVEITRHPDWNILQAHFSPDDRWVVFHTTNAPNLRQVYAVPAFLPAPVPFDEWVAVAPDFGIFPSWSSSGTASIASRSATATCARGFSRWIRVRSNRSVHRARCNTSISRGVEPLLEQARPATSWTASSTSR